MSSLGKVNENKVLILTINRKTDLHKQPGICWWSDEEHLENSKENRIH